jgi:hypothetical protein
MKFFNFFNAFVSITYQLKYYSKIQNIFHFQVKVNLDKPSTNYQLKLIKSPVYKLDYLNINKENEDNQMLVFDVKMKLHHDDWFLHRYSEKALGRFQFIDGVKNYYGDDIYLPDY